MAVSGWAAAGATADRASGNVGAIMTVLLPHSICAQAWAGGDQWTLRRSQALIVLSAHGQHRLSR